MARSESACSLGITEQADSYKSRSEFCLLETEMSQV